MDILRKAVHTAIVFFWYALIWSPLVRQSVICFGSLAHLAVSVLIFAAVKGIEAAYTQKKKSSEGESPE